MLASIKMEMYFACIFMPIPLVVTFWLFFFFFFPPKQGHGEFLGKGQSWFPDYPAQLRCKNIKIPMTQFSLVI